MPLAFTTGTSSNPRNTLQKRKFEIKVLLLLHVLIPGVMLSSSLETINPWLSACDLKQQGSSDLKGSCSAQTQFPARTTPPSDVELLCPKECQPNETKTNASCLAYLDETRRNAICNFNLGNGIEWLKSFLGTIRLRHCCEYKIIESLSSSLLERVLRGKDECFRIIDSLVEVDNLAARVTCEFSDVLSRYDCGQPYSVKFSCNDCLEAYRRWVCSTLVPYYNESVRIRPCRSVCQAVEQKCPYFLPENKAPTLPTQYAGEPTFLCMDPNIPETGEQQKRSLYPNEQTCCVKICGSLKDGLCVEKGTKCKSEELISYEEALDQTVECSASETIGSRVPSMECTASEPYSSPHKLGSSVARTSPGPLLVLLSAYLNHSLCRGLQHLIFFLFLSYFLFPMSFMQILVCLFVASAEFSRENLLLNRFRTETKLFFNFVKRPILIFNYFKFNNKKWQYYFILISVNLLSKLLIKNPQPLNKKRYLISVSDKISEKTRKARFYYVHCNDNNNYYYYHKHYYTIFHNIAQISNDSNFKSTLSYGFIPKRLNLVISINKITYEGKNFIGIQFENSLTFNRIKIHSCTIKIILIRNFIRKNVLEIAEASNRFVGFCRGRTRNNEAVAASVFSAGGALLNCARVDDGCQKHFLIYYKELINKTRWGGVKSEQNIKLNFVKMCFNTILLCSDPKSEFQTFLKIS